MCVYTSVSFSLFIVNPNFPKKKKMEGTEDSFKHMKTAVQFSMLEKELFEI